MPQENLTGTSWGPTTEGSTTTERAKTCYEIGFGLRQADTRVAPRYAWTSKR